MPDDTEPRISLRFAVLILAVILIVVTAASWMIAERTSLSFQAVMSSAGVLASIALTGMLVYLYNRMSQIQDTQREASVKQSKMMELQQEMVELEYKPKILIDEFRLKPSGIELRLRNLGRGLAEHIGVRPNIHLRGVDEEQRTRNPEAEDDHTLYADDDVFYCDPDTGTEYLSKISFTVRDEGEEFASKKFRGGMLSPEEGQVKFRSRIEFASSDPGQNGNTSVNPSQLFDYLREQGVEELSFSVDLVYCNELGESYAIPIMGRSGELGWMNDLADVEELQYSTTGTRSEVRETVSNNETYPPAE